MKFDHRRDARIASKRHSGAYILKDASTDMRYFGSSKLRRSLVHKKNFSFMWQVVFKLGYAFCQEREGGYLF